MISIILGTFAIFLIATAVVAIIQRRLEEAEIDLFQTRLIRAQRLVGQVVVEEEFSIAMHDRLLWIAEAVVKDWEVSFLSNMCLAEPLVHKAFWNWLARFRMREGDDSLPSWLWARA